NNVWRFKMKMVKSLLLGAAAGIVAVAGAQAADLPVKAKPVQYVKICSLYGAGFFYIPGTDTCIKLGGFMRYEIATGAGGSFAPFLTGANARFDRADTRGSTQRTRAVMSFDVRSQTAYGTLRSYIRIGAQWSSNDEYTSTPGASAAGSSQNNVFFDRGFIQLAGLRSAARSRSSTSTIRRRPRATRPTSSGLRPAARASRLPVTP